MRDGYLDCFAWSSFGGSTDRTFDSFGFEWNNFDDVREEDAGFAEVYFRDLDLTSLDGKVGLDAGCGKGRYTRFLAPHLAALAALDGSSAVEAAARNLADFDNVVVVKSDLRTAPFAAEASTSSPASGSSTISTTPGPASNACSPTWPRAAGCCSTSTAARHGRPAGDRAGRRRRAPPLDHTPASSAAQGAEHAHRRRPLRRGRRARRRWATGASSAPSVACPWTPTGASPSAAWCSTPSTG